MYVGEIFKIHPKKACNQIKRQKNCSEYGESSHDVVCPVALSAKVHLNRSLCT